MYLSCFLGIKAKHIAKDVTPKFAYHEFYGNCESLNYNAAEIIIRTQLTHYFCVRKFEFSLILLTVF